MLLDELARHVLGVGDAALGEPGHIAGEVAAVGRDGVLRAAPLDGEVSQVLLESVREVHGSSVLLV